MASTPETKESLLEEYQRLLKLENVPWSKVTTVRRKLQAMGVYPRHLNREGGQGVREVPRVVNPVQPTDTEAHSSKEPRADRKANACTQQAE